MKYYIQMKKYFVFTLQQNREKQHIHDTIEIHCSTPNDMQTICKQQCLHLNQSSPLRSTKEHICILLTVCYSYCISTH